VTTIAQLLISGLMIGAVYALMSLGLTLIFGVMRIVNFAHGEFLMIAMYGAWAISGFVGHNSYVAAVVVVPALFVFGVIVYRLMIAPALERPHLVIVFVTMGLSIVLQNLALMAFTGDMRDQAPLFARALRVGPFFLKPELLIGAGFSLATTLLLMGAIRWTYFGKAVRATVQDREAAALMGINVPRLFLVTFGLGSALVGLAGCMMLPLFSTFPTVGLNFVLIAFVVVVLGGLGSVEGAFLGGLCIGVVQSLSGYYVAPAYGQMFYFLLFLGVMVVRPSGLLGQRGTAAIGINP
jgi:branched-chain amino acid transport system permease protein